MSAAVHTGHYISGAGHALLIGWAALGAAFVSEPVEFDVTDVALISSEDFAALSRQQTAPSPATDLPGLADVTETAPAPNMVSAPETTPDRVQPAVPVPDAPDAAPVPPAPSPAPADLAETVAPMPEPADQVAVAMPAPAPPPAPAPRVAPRPVAAPPPEADLSDTVRNASTPDPEAARTDPAQRETAPEAATTEIVTEAEIGEKPPVLAAPSRSLRPKARPQRTVAEAPPDPAPEVRADAVTAALAAAMQGGAAAAEAQPGARLTGAEASGLRMAVEACWVVDVGSRAADVTVTVGMSLERDGRVLPGSLRLVSAEGGDAGSVDAAFQSARRAILRCERGGYDLPVEKYEQWRDIEMTFNPERMRIK